MKIEFPDSLCSGKRFLVYGTGLFGEELGKFTEYLVEFLKDKDKKFFVFKFSSPEATIKFVEIPE